MKRPKTMARYADLVEQALIEVDEMRHVIEYETDGGASTEFLDPLEADINPAERYLMERFIYGAARLHGEPRRRGRYLTLENPALKPSDYRPCLKVVSYDIETAMHDHELYSIAVHGTGGGAPVILTSVSMSVYRIPKSTSKLCLSRVIR